MSEAKRVVVLVVDDEAIVRMTIADGLAEAGFDILEAECAASALTLLEQRPDVGVLFTDIDMPGAMDGQGLAAEVRKRWPPIAVLLTSGQPSEEVLPDRCLFIPKPYSPGTVAALLTDLAGGEAGSCQNPQP